MCGCQLRNIDLIYISMKYLVYTTMKVEKHTSQPIINLKLYTHFASTGASGPTPFTCMHFSLSLTRRPLSTIQPSPTSNSSRRLVGRRLPVWYCSHTHTYTRARLLTHSYTSLHTHTRRATLQHSAASLIFQECCSYFSQLNSVDNKRANVGHILIS